jgi:hypothetical protein
MFVDLHAKARCLGSVWRQPPSGRRSLTRGAAVDLSPFPSLPLGRGRTMGCRHDENFSSRSAWHSWPAVGRRLRMSAGCCGLSQFPGSKYAAEPLFLGISN